MKVYFFTYADKRPDFIPYQLKSMQHFVNDDFELIVFDNAALDEDSKAIQAICKAHHLKYIRVDWPFFNGIKRKFRKYAALACAHPIQWSFHKYIKNYKNSICSIIDSDMFFINHFSVTDYMRSYNIAAVKQNRGNVNYLWNGIMFFDISKLPAVDTMDFMLGKINGFSTDVGGKLYYWINENNDNIKLRNIRYTRQICYENANMNAIPESYLNSYNQDYKIEIYEKVILHYGSGSNWKNNPVEYHKNKTEFVFNWVDDAIRQNIKLPEYDNTSIDDVWKY